MRDSDILKALISQVYDPDHSDIGISLADCLELHSRLLLAERSSDGKRGGKRPPEDKPALVPAPESKDGAAPALKTGGAGRAEKQRAYERLLEFREANGVGSYAKLAEAANGALSADNIRDMASAHPFPLDKWRKLAEALDYLGKAGLEKYPEHS